MGQFQAALRFVGMDVEMAEVEWYLATAIAKVSLLFLSKSAKYKFNYKLMVVKFRDILEDIYHMTS